jgi:hypothetical protein
MATSARTHVPVVGERWRELTLQANVQHNARDYRGALRLYNAALDEAEAVLGGELREAGSDRVIGPLLLTISDHNLAQVARAQGKLALATKHLVLAFERLVGLGIAREVPLRIRSSAARSLRIALGELLGHLGVEHRDPQATRLIVRAKMVLHAVEEAERACAH